MSAGRVEIAFGHRTIHAEAYWSGIQGDGASVTFCVLPAPRTSRPLNEVLALAQEALERALTDLGAVPATEIGLVALATAMLPWFREAEESGLLVWSDVAGDVRQSVFICPHTESSSGAAP